jgi:hypothetical protein
VQLPKDNLFFKQRKLPYDVETEMDIQAQDMNSDTSQVEKNKVFRLFRISGECESVMLFTVPFS